MIEIKVLKKVLAANDQIAEDVRRELVEKKIFCINIMSSPGSGKTTLIDQTIVRLKDELRIGVIEGDIATSLDAEKLSRHEIPVVSINTGPFGGDCHLEAGWIRDAARSLDLENLDLLIIENIGNLVCPAEFDTGSHEDVLILSITEGEDKPAKYPLAFNRSNLLILNKMDIAEYLDFNMEGLVKNVNNVNPGLQTIALSAKTGDGLDEWISWIKNKISNFAENKE